MSGHLESGPKSQTRSGKRSLFTSGFRRQLCDFAVEHVIDELRDKINDKFDDKFIIFAYHFLSPAGLSERPLILGFRQNFLAGATCTRLTSDVDFENQGLSLQFPMTS